MAARSLSQKRIQERIWRHRHAVTVLALMRAKKAVQAQIRAKGQRISDYKAKEISYLAHDYLAQHGERLRAEAEHTIATSSLFAYLRINAQKENEPKSITSAVQMSGAK